MLKSLVLSAAAAQALFSVGFAAQPALIDSGYQKYAFASCHGNDCEVDFPVTTMRVTEITNVSCYTNLIPNGTQIQYAALSSIATNGDYGGPTFILQSFVIGGISDNFAVGLNGATKLFFTAGMTPYVKIEFTTPTELVLSCTIAGYEHT